MSQFFLQYGLFLSKAVTVAVFIVLVAAGVGGALSRRNRKGGSEGIQTKHLNKEYENMERQLAAAVLSPQALRQKQKAVKKADKAIAKHRRKNAKKPRKEKRMFVLDFNGDKQASAVEALRQEVSAILTIAEKSDEVLVRLESGGGVVHGYGLAASQLQRIRERKIPLTIAVDKIAASGGYMMACVGDKIIAAPFAIIGSIGVLAEIPNLHRFLQKHDVDYEQLYAGQYKRTLSLFGENTDKGRKKVQQELEDAHALFKQYVKSQRPKLDIEKVATGEHWFGSRAQQLGLVDELQTSDDYLMSARTTTQLISVEYQCKQNLLERVSSMASKARRNTLGNSDMPLLGG